MSSEGSNPHSWRTGRQRHDSALCPAAAQLNTCPQDPQEKPRAWHQSSKQEVSGRGSLGKCVCWLEGAGGRPRPGQAKMEGAGPGPGSRRTASLPQVSSQGLFPPPWSRRGAGGCVWLRKEQPLESGGLGSSANSTLLPCVMVSEHLLLSGPLHPSESWEGMGS